MHISTNYFKKTIFATVMFSFCFSTYASVESEKNANTIDNTGAKIAFSPSETLEEAQQINQNLKTQEQALADQLQQVENKTMSNERKIKALKMQIDLINN